MGGGTLMSGNSNIKHGIIPPLTEHRQSTLKAFETCGRRTRRDLQVGDVTTGWTEDTADLGTVFHSFAAEYIRTIWATGHMQMATEDAINVAREVYAAGDIVLPTESRHTLRKLVFAFCEYQFDMTKLLACERRITLDIACPDGEIRTLKGQPDLIMRDGDDGIIIWDWKTGMGKPKQPREAPADGAVVVGKQYLSERGHFQLDTYGVLALLGVLEDGSRLAANATRASLNELSLRWGGALRQASITTDDFEHILPDLADHMMKLDRAIGEGPKSPLWKERPGSHCLRQCPVARSCPVPREMRGDGSLTTQAQADELARSMTVWDAQSTQARGVLKAWQEAGNAPARANDREAWRWGPDPDAFKAKGGGRSFKLWPTNGNGGS